MKKIFAIVLALISFSAHAELKSHKGKITGYIASEQGANKVFFFKLEGNPSGGCNTTSRFVVESTSPRYEGIQSAILASFHSKTEVNVYFHETCNTGQNGFDSLWVCVGDIPC